MRNVAALIALVLASMALVACGSSNSNSSSSTSGGETSGGAAEGGEKSGGGGSTGGGETLEFETDPGGELAYTTTEATAKAGKVTVDLNNPQGLTHDVAIEGSNGEVIAKTDLIAGEETSTTANLKPGTYTYYCTVPGHREAGMEGTLTVK